MNKLKFKIILAFFVGMVIYISHIMVYREITANSDFSFFSAIFFLLFFTLWTGTGVLLSPFKQNEKPHFLFTILCIAPASLLSLIVIQLMTTSYPVQNYADLALVALTGCFPLGITSGIILVSARNSVTPALQKHVAFFAGIGYFTAGFILYPLALLNVLINPTIYTLSSNSLILIIALLALKFKRARSTRYWILTFSAIIIALNFSLLKFERYTLNNLFQTCFPDWKIVKSYLTHNGRISLFHQNSKRFMVLRNTKNKQIIPDDCLLYKTTIIPFSLQPNKKDLSVLAISSPFSFVPGMLASLPYIKDVTMLAAGRSSIPMRILRNFSMPPFLKVNIIDTNAKKYFKKSNKKFDLIIWLSPDQEYLNFDFILKLCRLNMTKDGVLAVPASLLAVNNAQSSCRKMFKNKILIPGKSRVYAFSNAALTSNLNILEKRLDKLDTREAKMFPAGTFSIIYSIPHKTPALSIDISNNVNENSFIRSFNSVTINLKNILIIFVISCAYFIIRFFLLRRKKLQAVANLFENGLCLMLLMMILTTLYGLMEGVFYYNFGTILAAISGIPIGIGLSQFKLRRLAVLMSIVVIFMASLHLWEYYSYFIPGITFINFICGGIIIANIFKQNPDADIKLLSIHFLACALGAAIIFALLIMHFTLISCLFIVILFRIPLIFSKMFLGKFEANNV